MGEFDPILNYLIQTYSPQAILIYGSFADGSNNENSDFDALIIADHAKTHDVSIIAGTVLDVFVYPADYFQEAYDPEEFLQVFDGMILFDKDGVAERLKRSVLDYIANIPQKTPEELVQSLAWCDKMLMRTERRDAEGYYRWHWLLQDSLEIYCDLRGWYFFGPKKALRRMEQEDTESFQIYKKALSELIPENLTQWVGCLRQQYQNRFGALPEATRD